MLCYMFTISRCAMCGYDHVRGYLKKMIRIGIILALGCMDEAEEICRQNQLVRVCLNSIKRPETY